MRSLYLAVAAAILSGVVALDIGAPAAAQIIDDDIVVDEPAPRRTRRNRTRQRAPIVEDLGMECPKMCENDTAPCDPPAFKRMDGRCAGVSGVR